MVREIRTTAQVFRRVLIVTVISVVASLAISQTVIRFAIDATLPLTAADFGRLSLFFSIFVPGIVCPLVCWRSSRLMQALTLARDELETLALTDQLTGLLNRRGFDAAARAALDEARAAARPMAALMCDVDDFKALNDGYGHGFGDDVLRRVADALRQCAEGGRFIAGRQGGDEFAMMLPGVERGEAEAVAERIRAACGKAGAEGSPLSLSIGVAVSARSKASLTTLLRRADLALYEGKRNGGDRIAAADAEQPEPRAAKAA